MIASEANASLDLFEKVNYSGKIKKIEKTFEQELVKFKKFKFIKELRVKGAIAVIEFFNLSEKNIIWLRKEFIKENIWVRPLKNIIYFMPPFIINNKELKSLLKSTYNILLKLERSNEK